MRNSVYSGAARAPVLALTSRKEQQDTALASLSRLAGAGTGLGSSPTFCRALLTMSKVSDSGAAATQVPRRLLAPGNGLDSLKHHPCRHTELQRFKNGAPKRRPLHCPSNQLLCSRHNSTSCATRTCNTVPGTAYALRRLM